MDDEAQFTFRQCGAAIEVFHGDEPLTETQVAELVQFLNIIGEDVIALVKKMNSITLS